MDAGPRIDSYEWRGGREAILRWGPETGPVVVLALPLFEEANRTRAFGVGLLRALGQHGIGGVLPDLPGQGESEQVLADFSILALQDAYDAAVTHAGLNFSSYGVAVRSGALLDALGLLAGRWHFAPQTGAELLGELRRIRQTAVSKALPDNRWWFDGTVPGEAPDPPVAIAGNLIGTSMLTDLVVKEPFDEPGIARRVVRLATDRRPADRKVDAAPLWRRAEPGNDPALVRLLAADIAEWIAYCER